MIKKPAYCLLILCFIAGLSLQGCGDHTADTSSSTEGKADVSTEAESTLGSSPEETSTEEPTTEEPTTVEPTTEVPTTTEPTTEEPTTAEPSTEVPTTAKPSTEAPLTINDVAFVGDSRTLTMATGGRLEFNLIPDSSVFATWGGELHQDSAKQNALAAAAANRKLAVFWYGINDVQSDPGMTLSDQFLANYKAIIDIYHTNNPDSEIVILSILSTSIHEQDYYSGQEDNIRLYNQKLADLCAQEGYTYLDISSLFTGDECLAPGDYIHFSKSWYETRFLPTVLPQIGVR